MEIVARDSHGDEHHLEVTRLPGGLIVVRDDEVVRVLAPGAALELGLQLLRCVTRRDELALDESDPIQADVDRGILTEG